MALEKIVINVSGQADLDSTIKKLVELGVIDEKNAKSFQANSKQTQNELDKTKSKYSGLKDVVNDYVGALPGAQHVQQISNVTNSLTSATTATGGAARSMGVLRVAMTLALGPIGLLIGAFVALISFFKRTDDGATKLEGILGAVGAVIDEITGFIAEFGSAVFDAISSTEGFGNALSNLGDTILTNLINRFTSLLVLAESIQLLFDGKFKEAAIKANDAYLQFTLGIENGTKKLTDFGDRISKAAKDAFEFAVAMDAISDAQRELNVELSANKILIVELIKQSKNHTLSIDERVAKLQKANQLDEQGLQKTLELEKKKLELLLSRNKREQDAINQRLTASIAEAKTEEEKIKLRQKSLSISDKLEDERAAQQIKINNLIAESVALQERNNTAIANLRQQDIQDQLKAEADRLKKIAELEAHYKKLAEDEFKDSTDRLGNHYTQRLNALKQSLIDGQITQEEFNKASQDLLFEALESEKVVYQDYGKDIIDIEAKILDEKLKIKNKEAEEAKKKREKDIADEKKAAEEKKRINQLYTDAVINNFTAISNALFESSQRDLDNEKHKFDLQVENQLSALEKRNKNGIISDEQFAAQSEAIKKKQAQKDLEFRRRQAQAEKNQALFNIAINTGSAILKGMAQFGPPIPTNPLGIAAFISTLATGAVQAGIVSSRPLPQFKKGGFTGEGNPNDTAGIVHKSEFVMPADKTAQYRDELEAMYKGRFKHRDPIKLDKSLTDLRGDNMAENIYKSMLLSGFDDKGIINAISKNNKVKMGNTDELANKIAGRIGDRMGEGRLYA